MVLVTFPKKKLYGTPYGDVVQWEFFFYNIEFLCMINIRDMILMSFFNHIVHICIAQNKSDEKYNKLIIMWYFKT